MLLVDLSASGRFGTLDRVKQEAAAEVAAILAFNAIRNNDKVGAILFTDRVEKYIPPLKGSAHVWRVIKELYTFKPSRQATDIPEAVAFLGRVCRKRSVAFLISDFLSSEKPMDFSLQFKSVSRKHELIGVRVSDPGEFTLPSGGLIALQDMESGRVLNLDAFDQRTKQRYESQKQNEYRDMMDNLKRLKIDCIELSTAGSAADALTRYFRFRERRKR
jgi:uncharacterized protein (DUF58 family)